MKTVQGKGVRWGIERKPRKKKMREGRKKKKRSSRFRFEASEPKRPYPHIKNVI